MSEEIANSILVLEDDKVDQMSITRSCKELKLENPIFFSEDGEIALEKLGELKDNLPCLILLDLKMPKMNGTEFLDVIKRNKLYENIPVIVVTSSGKKTDLDQSFDQDVSGYIVKPYTSEKINDVLEFLDIPQIKYEKTGGPSET